MKFEYDLMNEADFPSINIASGVEGDEVTEGIPDPYADQSPRIEVPEMVYTQDPPYDTSVVEIGEKVYTCMCVNPRSGWPFVVPSFIAQGAGYRWRGLQEQRRCEAGEDGVE